jgi:ribonuclease HI
MPSRFGRAADPANTDAEASATRNLVLFADGSLRLELGLGSWAYAVPKLALEGSGCGPGKTVAHFELKAVVEGLRALRGFGLPCVHIVSDCRNVAACVQAVQENIPSKGAGISVVARADYAALREAIDQLGPEVSLCVGRPEKTSIGHRSCHNAARRCMRDFIQNSEVYRDRAFRHRLALWRTQRDKLGQHLQKLNRRIAAAETELAAAITLKLGNDFFVKDGRLFPSLGYGGEVLDVLEEVSEGPNRQNDGRLLAVLIGHVLWIKRFEVEHGSSSPIVMRFSVYSGACE